jgi:hypothetical protein
MVQIGALFAVDLDADKMLIQVLGHFGVFKRLPLHHVAPMAGGIAYRQENRLLFPPCLLSLHPQGNRVHRIFGVLLKIRALSLGARRLT